MRKSSTVSASEDINFNMQIFQKEDDIHGSCSVDHAEQSRLIDPANLPLSPRDECKREEQEFRRVNVKYRSTAGRRAVLEAAVEIHYDFGALNNLVSVTVPAGVLRSLTAHPDIEYAGGDGNVMHCSMANGRVFARSATQIKNRPR